MPRPGKFRDTGCPFAFALDTFGDRWSLIVIRDMLMKGYRTYGEFLGSDEKIATNVLADRLQDLESAGIVTKQRDPENRRRVLYSLTEKGADLAPVMLEIARWSARYDPNTNARESVIRRIEKDRDGFAADLKARALDRGDRFAPE